MPNASSNPAAALNARLGARFMPTPRLARRLGERDVLTNAMFLVIGGLCPLSVTLVGQLFVGEMLLAAVFVAYLAASRAGPAFASPVFRRLGLFLALMLAALVLSDFYHGTSAKDCVRGWSRIAVLMLDAGAITVAACGKPSRRTLWWFLAGYGIGGVIVAASENPDLFTEWKLGAGAPATVIVLCLLTFVPRWTARVGILFALAAAHIALDFRSMGGFLAAVAAIEFAHEHRNVDRRALVLPGLALAAGLLVLLGFALQAGEHSVEERREESNAARLIQLRIATRAILDSPVTGYGSWAKDRRYANEFFREMGAYLGRPAYRDPNSETMIPAHSQILQAWIEAGAVSLLFFVYFAWRLARGVRSVALDVSFGSDTSLMALFLVMALWHAFFSPFSGSHRVEMGVAIAVVTLTASAEAAREKAGMRAGRRARARAAGMLRRLVGLGARSPTSQPAARPESRPADGPTPSVQTPPLQAPLRPARSEPAGVDGAPFGPARFSPSSLVSTPLLAP